MADEPTISFGENTPEAIAYKLMQDVLKGEATVTRRDRASMLDTYAECLEAAKGKRTFGRAVGPTGDPVERRVAGALEAARQQT